MKNEKYQHEKCEKPRFVYKILKNLLFLIKN